VGFDEQTDLDGVMLTARQLPLVPYGVTGLLCTFVAFPMASLLPEAVGGLLLAPLMMVAVPGFIVATMFSPTAHLELTTSELRLRAWVGWPFARPRTMRLPMRTLTAAWGSGSMKVNGRPVRGVTFHAPPHAPVYVPMLRVSDAEHRVLVDRVDGMRALAGARHGDGEAEVPEALRELVSPGPQGPTGP